MPIDNTTPPVPVPVRSEYTISDYEMLKRRCIEEEEKRIEEERYQRLLDFFHLPPPKK